MNTAHPNFSFMPTESVIKTLRGYTAHAEKKGQLTADQLDTIYENKWFKLFVPREFDGLELSLPEGVRLEEELAYTDGSLGWTVTLCAGANLFSGYIDPTLARRIFTDPQVCLGGSGRPSGIATIKDGGYEVNGIWHYATGAPHNTHFTANCVIEQDGKPVRDSEGNPLIKSFFFDQKDVRIVADWNTVGLKATASHSFEVKNVWVEQRHAFLILPEHARQDGPVYRYPFIPFAQTTLAVNTLGMARHFIACCEDLAISHDQIGKTNEILEGLLQQGVERITIAKRSFYEALDASWDIFLQNGQLTETILQRITETSRALVSVSQGVVVSLYPHCGIIAADESSTINRIWRDIFTASQHSLLR